MEEIIEKIRELMLEVDPTLDVSDGSAFDQVVLNYIENSFGVGDLDLDLEDMMIRRIGQLDPEINTSPGSAVHEFLIKVLPAIFQVPQLEVQRIKDNQDFNNIPNMTDAEVDRRVSNFFVTRREGDVSVGFVRAFFSNPVPVQTNLSNRAVTASGLSFFPDGTFEASRNVVAANRQDGLFYVDIPYVAEASGNQYNIVAESITNIENMPGLVRATNPSAFAGGVPRETNEGLVARAKQSLAERSLSSRNSIITIITENLPNQALSIAPVGFGDSEMQRDAFTVLPSVILDGVILKVFVPTGVGNEGPYDLDHAEVDPTSIVVYSDTSEVLPANYTIIPAANPVTDVMSIELDGVTPTTSVTIQYVPYANYAPLVTNIPGSIEVPPLFPTPAQEQVVHVGGKADLYIKPGSEQAAALTINGLGRYTLFKASDAEVYIDSGDGLWYFRTSRGTPVAEIGAHRGDILELITLDQYGNPTVKDGDRLVIARADVVNNRYLLEAGPGDSVERFGVDVKIRLSIDRALPLERLVAVDSQGSPIFLDNTGLPTGRSTEYDPSINIPVSPTLGHINRDSSLPEFSKTFQTKLPTLLLRESTELAFRPSGVDAEDTGDGVPIGGQRFEDGGESLGKLLYAVAEENIASGNILTPWVRFTRVNFFDSLTQKALPAQPIRNIYPTDIRSVDLSGGIDSDATNAGFEPSGKVRVYFEDPLTLMMYGQAYGANATRFIHRVTREVEDGQLIEFNLVYRLTTHSPAGGPAIIALPSDFTEENGMWYLDVFVRGVSAESERSDGNPVRESDLNLGDGAELWLGAFALADEVYHRIDELEFEKAGDPVARSLETGATNTPVDADHPYADLLGTWSGTSFTGSGSPQFLENQVQSGFFVKILEQSTVPFRPGIVSGVDADVTLTEDDQVTIGPGNVIDFEAEGVQVGDVIELFDGVTTEYREVTGFSQVTTLNDTLTFAVASTIAGNDPITLSIYKWVTVDEAEIVDVVSETALVLSKSVTAGGLRYVIVDQSGTFRLKNPHVRLGTENQSIGSPGNEANKGFRAEGYWFDTRNPFDRRFADSTYTFSEEEFTYFRYTAGADTRYLPNKAPLGSEIDLPRGGASLVGRYRDNFTFLSGSRVAVEGTGFQLAVGPGLIWTATISGASTDVNLLDDSADPDRIRVFIPIGGGAEKELVQIPTGNTPAAGEYVFEHSAGGSFGAQGSAADRIVISAADAADALANGGGRVQYFSKLQRVVLLDEASPAYLSGSSLDVQDGTLVVFFAGPATAADIAQLINDQSLNYFSMIGEDDIAADITASAELLDQSSTGTVTFDTTTGYFEDTAVDFSALGTPPQAGDVLYVESATNQGFYPITAVSPGNVNRLLITTEFGTASASVNADYRILRSFYNAVDSRNGLGENFLSREITGRSIQIFYEWSSSVQAVHDFVTATDVRSINQDLLVRHGIPVFVNVEMSIESNFVDTDALSDDVREFILLLDQQNLRTSDLVRLPTLAEHIPLPLLINGLTILENRRFRTYRDADGIEPRRIEALMPGEVDITGSA